MRRALFGVGQRHASLIATTLTSTDVATIAAIAAPAASIFAAGIGAAAYAVRKFEGVRSEINNLAIKMNGDLGKVTAEMKGDLGKVAAEMKGDLGKMDVKVDETVKRVEATSRAFAESESHKVAASRSALAR
jgi:hypothetical protein